MITKICFTLLLFLFSVNFSDATDSSNINNLVQLSVFIGDSISGFEDVVPVNLNKTLYYDGGSPICDAVYCDNTIWTETFACSEATTYVDPGNWNNGTNSFDDPSSILPVGKNETYILVQVDLRITGTFDCKHNNLKNSSTEFSVFLQGNLVSSWKIQDLLKCECYNCATELNATTPMFFNGWPGYIYHGQNDITVNVVEGIVCFNSIILSLSFEKTESTLNITVSNTSDHNPIPMKWWKTVYFYVSVGVASGIGLIITTVLIVMLAQRRKNKPRSGYTPINEPDEERDISAKVKGIKFQIKSEEIKLGPRIGKGSYGEVFRAEWRGITVAVKKLPLSLLQDQNFLKDFNQEAVIMSSLRHPNVLQFLGSCMIENDVAILTEYMNRGSLYRLLHDQNFELTWSLVKRFALETAQGMLYLHRSTPPVLHRDLKSHNLLVDSTYRVKISDFGLSKVIDQLPNTMTSCGTAAWAAPEVLRNARYTEKADVFSYGICLWEFYTRQDPYEGMPTFQIIFSVGTEGLRPSIPSSCPHEFRTLIEDCWDSEPHKRPSFDVIIQKLKALE